MHARLGRMLPGGEVQEAGQAIWVVSATPLGAPRRHQRHLPDAATAACWSANNLTGRPADRLPT